MKINSPLSITPRLLPGIKIGDSFVSITYAQRPGDNGRTRYQWYIDTPSADCDGDDIQSGCQGGPLQSGLASLLSFLSAFAESIEYQTRTGLESENADIFPAAIADWATQYSDALSMLAYELEETPNLIVE